MINRIKKAYNFDDNNSCSLANLQIHQLKLIKVSDREIGKFLINWMFG